MYAAIFLCINLHIILFHRYVSISLLWIYISFKLQARRHCSNKTLKSKDFYLLLFLSKYEWSNVLCSVHITWTIQRDRIDWRSSHLPWHDHDVSHLLSQQVYTTLLLLLLLRLLPLTVQMGGRLRAVFCKGTWTTVSGDSPRLVYGRCCLRCLWRRSRCLIALCRRVSSITLYK